MIKKIHQIWMQGETNIPIEYRNNILGIREKNVDWHYSLYDENELYNQCSMYSPECATVFAGFKHMHQKVDLGRYVVLYNNGGMSVDMDTICKKSLNHIPEVNTNKELLVVSKININAVESFIFLKSNITLINNAHIYSPNKKNIVLKSIIDYIICLRPKKYRNKTMEIMHTTGPIMFSKQIAKHFVIILDSVYFEPDNVISTNNDTQDTIIIHTLDNTWVDASLETRLLSVYKVIKKDAFVIFLIIIVLFLLFFRSGVRFNFLI